MSRFQRLVEDVGCVVCSHHFGIDNYKNITIHHLRVAGLTGTAQKASDDHTIPLCKLHHQSADGTMKWSLPRNGILEPLYSYHNNPEMFEKTYGSQLKLLDITNKMLQDGVSKSKIIDI